MEEFKIMPETTDLGSSYSEGTSKGDAYYTNSGKKVGDFCLGFFGAWGLTMVLTIIPYWIYSIFSSSFAVFPILLFGFALAVIGIVLSFTKGRRYIGIGIIASVLLPLLLVGACLIIFAGSSGF
jgi:heme/copper-type cytochrome/quinol oxidase subunit 4